MNTLDLILLAFVAIGFSIGLFRGFVREAIGMVGVLLAAIAANWASPYTVPTLSGWIGDRTAAAVVVWVVVFLLAMFAMRGVAYLLGRIVRAAMLGWLNRLAGGLLGALKYVLIASLLLAVVAMLGGLAEDLPLSHEIRTSRVVPYLHRVVDLVMPWCTEHLINPALEMIQP